MFVILVSLLSLVHCSLRYKNTHLLLASEQQFASTLILQPEARKKPKETYNQRMERDKMEVEVFLRERRKKGAQ